MSMLKISVFVGFFLLALVSVSHAACYHERLQLGATHCQDSFDKTIHPIGSTWRNSMCDHCSCHANIKSCCEGWPTKASGPCTIKYDYETCTYELIHPDKNVGCVLIGK